MSHSKDIILVNADKGRLNQVLSNLLDNALKFTKEGNIIIATKKKKDNRSYCDIKDSGTGIDPEILPQLFTKFATKSEQGTGLGSIYFQEYNRSSWRYRCGQRTILKAVDLLFILLCLSQNLTKYMNLKNEV